MDERLEYGVEMSVEISLRILSTLGMYNLPHSINSTIHVCLLFFYTLRNIYYILYVHFNVIFTIKLM